MSDVRNVLKYLWWPIFLTYVGLFCENVVKAFWIFFSIALIVLALERLDINDPSNFDISRLVLIMGIPLILGSFFWGISKLIIPSFEDAKRRLDSTLVARPLQGLSDKQVLGFSDPESKAMWHKHQQWLATNAKNARPVKPEIALYRQDRYGLCFFALFIFSLSMLFGSSSNIPILAQPLKGKNEFLANELPWEGWVTPPVYSALPTLYLNDLLGEPKLALLKGSRIEIRSYDKNGNYFLDESLSGASSKINPLSQKQHSFDVVQAGKINIKGPVSTDFEIVLSPDNQPTVNWGTVFDTDFYGESVLSFSASDDFGVVSGVARIELDLASIDRRFGLAADPRETKPIIVDLPLPLFGDRLKFSSKIVENFSKSVWSNLPVFMTLEVSDAVHQIGQSDRFATQLRGRKFFDPLASVLIEQRRDLLWSDENAARVAKVLRAISSKREKVFRRETDYLQLRFVITNLEMAYENNLLEERREELAEALWDLAMSIEEIDFEDTLQRMRNAQQRLSQAMKNGASDKEIEELLEKLKRANEDHLRQLSREALRSSDQNAETRSAGETMQLGQNDIEDMLDRIRSLMEQGRVAEAQQALDELQNMMEKMTVVEAEGNEGYPMEGLQEGLTEMLREQQRLSDQAFNNLQQQFGAQSQHQGNGKVQGFSNPEGQIDDSGSIANRQGILSDKLEGQRKELQGLRGDVEADVSKSLKDAQTAMKRAEKALEDGDLVETLDHQSESMEKLRDSIRGLGQLREQNQKDKTEFSRADGSEQSGDGRDPLGRTNGNDFSQSQGGKNIDQQDMTSRNQELLEEILRRTGQLDRPEDERSYLKNLLEKF